MRLLITAGGTGGHVYPALAVVASLRTRFEAGPGQGAGSAASGLRLQWVGAVGGMEAQLVARAGIRFEAIQAAAVVGVGPVRSALGLLRLGWGVLQAYSIIRRFGPDLLFVTGGYTAIPVTLACWLQRVPIVVYLPDIEPGAAVRFVARFARRVLVTRDESRQFFPPDKVVVTGYPVRPELVRASQVAPGEARRHFGLVDDRRTVLVFGGSRGARSLNYSVLAAVPELVTASHAQVLHITGQLDWPVIEERRRALPPVVQAHYQIHAYLHEDMGLALAAADLAVTRAGASTLGELPTFGLGAILVPYPHAWRYQKVNADTLAAQGAAIRLNDEDLQTRLAPTVRSLFAQPDRLQRMAAAARALAVPTASERLALQLVEQAEDVRARRDRAERTRLQGDDR